jgi:hypothetical protein
MSFFTNIPSRVLFMNLLLDEEERKLEKRSWKQRHLNAEGKRRKNIACVA